MTKKIMPFSIFRQINSKALGFKKPQGRRVILLTSNDKNCKIVSLGKSTCQYTEVYVIIREPQVAHIDL